MGCNQTKLNVVTIEEYEATVLKRNELKFHLSSLLSELNTHQNKFKDEELNGQTDESTEIAEESQRDIIERTSNHLGNHARIGATGKYYCNKEQSPPCDCCDSKCGPHTGCNCAACMRLDVKARSLPCGFLINREGRIARKNEDGRVYCGSKVLDNNPDSDGWCGPTSGPQCGACEILEQQWDTRYKEVYTD